MSKTFTINSTPSTTAGDLARRLSEMSGYREKSIDDARAVVSVGHETLMRLIGVYIFNSYTAPVEVEIVKEGARAQITMSPPSMMVKVGAKTEEFFARTYVQIEHHLA